MEVSEQLARALRRKRIILRQRDAALSHSVELRLTARATVLESRQAVQRARAVLEQSRQPRAVGDTPAVET